MRFKILTMGDEKLLLEFLQWLTPEALDLWSFYGRSFDMNKAREILRDFDSIKMAYIHDGKIIVFGHLYNFTDKSCRLGIVSGIVGQGYGTMLMGELLLICMAARVEKVCLSTYQDNPAALALYKKFGFNIVEEFTDRPRKKYEMELGVCWEKALFRLRGWYK